MDAKIQKLPWMNVDDHGAICRHVEFSNDYNKKYKNNPLMTDFAGDSMIKFLYGNNWQEGTLQKTEMMTPSLWCEITSGIVNYSVLNSCRRKVEC